MSQITFDTPVLKVKGLETKFDVIPVSNSLAILIGDRDTATIVQQLYHWTNQGYGEVIDGVRWFYKSIKEWIEEVFPTFSPWKLGKMMKELSDRDIIRREKLFTKHQIQNGDRFWWQPKNQTYYYSLNYQKLQELADNYPASKTTQPREKPHSASNPKSPETPENSVFVKTKILSNEEIKHTKVFDCAKNNTNITSIENSPIDQSHPTLPCVCEKRRNSNQKQKTRTTDNFELPELNSRGLVNSTLTNKELQVPLVEQKVNQNNCTAETLVQDSVQSEKPVAKPRVKTPKGTKSVSKRMKSAPWKDEGQFKRFYRALIQALPVVANARSPQGLAQVIIRQLRSGIPHTYWDDFAAGLPIGTSTKPEWEVEPGVPYPMFIEYLTEKIIKGNNTQTQEQARNEVFRILSLPRQASAFWGQFKRSVVNVSQQVERDLALGVRNPNTPVWTKERIEPSLSDAIAAGHSLAAANSDTQSAISGAERTNPQLEAELDRSDSATSSPVLDPWADNDSDSDRNGDSDSNSDSHLTLREMLAERNVKGFCDHKALTKQMPQVSESQVQAEARREVKPKTNINQMSVAEINDYLTDPLLRAQLTPQLMRSNYELTTDEMGRIIGVKPPLLE